MRWKWLPVCVLALAGMRQAAHADDDSGLPPIELLPCETQCANSVRAVHINAPIPPYPNIRDANGYVEGFVSLHYTVGVDGLVHDIEVDHFIGPNRFVTNAVDTVKEWTFKPATIDGNPVEQAMALNVVFSMTGVNPGGSKKFVDDYQRAVSLIKDGKYDEALARLVETNSKSNLNFYERGMLANLMAPLLLLKKDYLSVRELVSVPSEQYSHELPSSIEFNLLKFRIQADLALGDIGDALATVNSMKLRVNTLDANDPILKLVEDARAAASGMPQIATTERIPASGLGSARLLMSHRDFTFQNVSGSLEKFQIQCRQATITSRVSEAAEWHVPRNWNQCYLFIHGAPGTTFDVIQFANTQPVKAQ